MNQAVRDVYLRVAISIHKIHEVFHASSSSFDAQKMCDRNRRNPSYSLLSSKQSLDISDFLKSHICKRQFSTVVENCQKYLVIQNYGLHML